MKSAWKKQGGSSTVSVCAPAGAVTLLALKSTCCCAESNVEAVAV